MRTVLEGRSQEDRHPVERRAARRGLLDVARDLDALTRLSRP
jgi:hypothetical protein